jgi:hypothetical protein
MSYHVPTSAVPLLQDPPFVLWLLLLATALGYRCLRWMQAPRSQVSALEWGVLSAALGLGWLQYLPFALGMSGRLTIMNIGLGLILLTALLLPDMLRVLRGIVRAFQGWRKAPPPGWLMIGTLAVAFTLMPVFWQALTPPTDGDGLGYHLTAPKRWLQTGDLHYLPTLPHTQAPMGVEMLFTLALALRSDTAAKLIHFALGVVGLLAVFALGRRLRHPAVGFGAVALFLTGLPKIEPLGLFGSAFVDLGITCQLACATLAWVLWRRSQARAWWLCAALFAGFAVSFKLNGVFIGLALGVLVLIELRLNGKTWPQALGSSVGFIALAQVPLLPWLWRTWLQTGNPIYPELSGLFPTRDWSPAEATTFNTYMKYYNWGVSLGPGRSLAWRKLVRVLGMVGVTVIGAGIVWRWRDREARALVLLVTLLLLAGMAATGLYLRFCLPLLPLMCLLVCLCAAPLLTRTRWTPLVLAVPLMMYACYYIRQMYPDLKLTIASATGRLSRTTFLARYSPTSPLWDYANLHVPPGETILVSALLPAYDITGGLTYYSDHSCYMTDSILQNRFHTDNWNTFLSDIERDNIHYVVVPSKQISFRDLPDFPAVRNEYPFARRLVGEYGQFMFAKHDLELYRLDINPERPGGVRPEQDSTHESQNQGARTTVP